MAGDLQPVGLRIVQRIAAQDTRIIAAELAADCLEVAQQRADLVEVSGRLEVVLDAARRLEEQGARCEIRDPPPATPSIIPTPIRRNNCVTNVTSCKVRDPNELGWRFT